MKPNREQVNSALESVERATVARDPRMDLAIQYKREGIAVAYNATDCGVQYWIDLSEYSERRAEIDTLRYSLARAARLREGEQRAFWAVVVTAGALEVALFVGFICGG